MRDEMDIGCNPCDEPCVNLGEEDYYPRARAECLRFIELVRKKLGPEPPGARLKVKSNPHDFGVYLSVVVSFEDTDEEARHYAYRCESEAPRTWQDDQPLPQKRYSVVAYLTCRLQTTVEAESPHMAKLQAGAQARAKAQESGFDMDDYDEVVADVEEVKQAALAPPQS
jgi:alkanesulfonate monooxygenase SsuD/methylene tetrahydromethanopterin reductase-like flavin-dependent oxidoreductase (luciferase family)